MTNITWTGNSPIRQGEAILLPILESPKDAQLNKEEKSIIVSHSETGHHHVLETIDTSKIKVYTWNGDVYIEVPGAAKLWHQKTGSYVHETHKVQSSIYKLNIKKQYDYFTNKLRQVRD